MINLSDKFEQTFAKFMSIEESLHDEGLAL